MVQVLLELVYKDFEVCLDLLDNLECCQLLKEKFVEEVIDVTEQ